ncbi:sigma-54-dependent Fis family transcriptional regulator [Oleiphilus sp. HI0071]|nr:sigma-54-dependent Fis family transcriptional regulator [Oleiphilus sp. HI0065]KZY89219.1 sigma-54-dependent Fis family transcriptional regulator [Oleiphilus sp. HI0073]KZY90323.1 sigma-54-dependent Fis family transcriptional regulator [Oleiphilus sp. HI0071]KZZ51282.1 sigma-54-dependent Fis family transcriptional regulator [Oleiphilus sp. HI0122]KZZ52495.1 sigma-54-dependent Fis family transcriptional regulator [Oleiphilus sp. HI0118]KZZ81470.1 sigma-54-dependent Fis family transcriptional
MAIQRILIIDDEPDIRELLQITLMRMGLDTRSAECLSDAEELLQTEDFSLCLTDMNLPDGNGIDFVRMMQTQFSDTPVAMITAYGSIETAIEALKAGAFDFISKPVDLAQLRNLVSSALRLQESSQVAIPNETEDQVILFGESPALKKLSTQVKKLSRSQAPIYISGESGSGKELVARAIHGNGARASGPFIPVNCGAIPSELMESEFFGHRKGSFSGAHQDKDGLFKAADGGTLFLDEVADLPIDMQVKLLRAIQEKAVRAVGAESEERVDVRILSATHKDLQALVDAGEFRQDLFYRINVINLQVPSLRERQTDIPILAERFLNQVAQECDVDGARIDSAAMQALTSYSFPGNVRELENIIERAFTLCEDEVIREADLQLEDAPKIAPTKTHRIEEANSTDPIPESGAPALVRPEGMPLEAFLEDIERREIESALQQTKWNRTAAAKMLGMSFRSMRYRLKKLGLD